MTASAPTALFSVFDAYDEYDLWVTNGTAAGTTLLAAGILSDGEFFFPSYFTYINNEVLFAGYRNLWVTDGTVQGTTELNVSNSYLGGLRPSYLTQFGDEVVFAGYDANYADNLWVTNGTSQGTYELNIPDAYSRSADSGLFLNIDPCFTPFDSKLVFVGLDESDAPNLWISDGTAQGTFELLSADASSAGLFSFGDPEYDLNPNFTVISGQALFEGTDATGDDNLFVSDGTSAGTSELNVAGANPNGLFDMSFGGVSFYGNSIVLGNKVLFEGIDTTFDCNLFVSDGTPSGSYELTVAGAAATGLFGSSDTLSTIVPHFVPIGADLAVFVGLDAEGYWGLWRTDGSSTGTTEITVPGGYRVIGPNDLIEFDNEAMFAGVNSAGVEDIFVTDGTSAGTHGLSLNLSQASPGFIGTLNGEELFSIEVAVSNGSGGFTDQASLWSTDGTPAGTVELSSQPNFTGAASFTDIGDKALIATSDGLWVTDGTPGGTSEISNTTNLETQELFAIPSYSLSPSNLTVTENARVIIFTITRGNLNQPETLYFSTVQDTVSNPGRDYFYQGIVNEPVNFSAGEATQQVSVNINDLGLTAGSEISGVIVQASPADPVSTYLANASFAIENTDQPAALPPVLTGPSRLSKGVNQSFSFLPLLIGSDPGATIISYTFSEDNDGAGTLTQNGTPIEGTTVTVLPDELGQIEFQTGNTSGTNQVTVSVSDDRGLTSANLSIEIGISAPDTASSPEIAGPSVLNGYTGIPVSLAGVQATDPDGVIESYQFTIVSGFGFFDKNASLSTTAAVLANQLGEVGFDEFAPGQTVIGVKAVDANGQSSPESEITITVANPPPPASGLQLVGDTADLMADVYNGTNSKGKDGYVPLKFDDPQDGFFAAAYGNSTTDPTQIIIAFRGTEQGNIKNYWADTSFLSGNPMTSWFETYLTDAASFVQDIYDDYSIVGSTVLTGQSLGGAIAQVMGQLSGLTTLAYDAPGAYQFMPSVENDPSIANISQLGPGDLNIDYRLYGDQVSLVGTPFSNGLVTILNSNNGALPTDVATNHDPNLLDQTIQGDIANLGELDVTTVGPNYTYSSIVDQIALDIGTGVNPGTQYTADPPAGSDFSLTVSDNSPSLNAIALPSLPGVQLYELRYEIGSDWSNFQEVWPTDWTFLPTGVDAIEFSPLDSTSHSVLLTDGLDVSITFASGGTATVNLTASDAQPSLVTIALAPNVGTSTTLDVTNNPMLVGSADPNAVISLTDNNEVLGTTTADSAGNWTFDPTGLTDGTQTISVSETDLAGNILINSVTFTLKTSTPAPSSLDLSPSSDSGAQGDNLTNVMTPVITGTGEAGDTLALFDAAAAVGTTTVGLSGTWSITTNTLSPGTHTLTAIETDVVGNVSSPSAPLDLTIETAAPTLVNDTPLSVAEGTPGTITSAVLQFADQVSSDTQAVYSITSSPSQGTLLVDDSAASTFTQAEIDSGNVSYQETAIGASSDSFTFKVTDAAGNTTTPQQFQIQISQPTQAPPALDPLMTNAAGALVLDQLAGGQLTYEQISGLGPEWEFDGTGANLLGNGNAGFLIRDTGTIDPGALYVGQIANGAATYTPIGGLGTEWQFQGDDDFLGTGQTEFLIRNTGTVIGGALYLGQVVNGAAAYTAIGGLGSEWEFDGTGDFLGDNNQGFLIRNTGSAEPGALDVGEILNGSVQYTQIGGVGTEWQFEGTGDFFGDGHTDFLIYNTGTVAGNKMEIGEFINGQLTFSDIGSVGPEWQFVGTGNYIDSDRTDFLLRNTGNGSLVVAGVTGAPSDSHPNGVVAFTVVGGIGPEWTFHNTSPALLS